MLIYLDFRKEGNLHSTDGGCKGYYESNVGKCYIDEHENTIYFFENQSDAKMVAETNHTNKKSMEGCKIIF